MPPKKNTLLEKGLTPKKDSRKKSRHLIEKSVIEEFEEIPKSKLNKIIDRIINFIKSEDAKQMSIDAVKAIMLGIIISGFAYKGFKIVELGQRIIPIPTATQLLLFDRVNPILNGMYRGVKSDLQSRNPDVPYEQVRNRLFRGIYEMIAVMVNT